MPLQRNDEKYRIAKEKGYKSTKDGDIIGLRGYKLKGKTNNKGYKLFSVTISGGVNLTLLFHRFIAYEKYGEELFEEGIVARHLDGDCTNNSWDNIAIGTQADNMQDIPKHEVYKKAKRVGELIRKYDYEKIRDYYKENNHHMTLEHIRENFNATCESTIAYILDTDPDIERNINGRKYDYNAVIDYYNSDGVSVESVKEKFGIISSQHLYNILENDPNFERPSTYKYDYEAIIQYHRENPDVELKEIAKIFNVEHRSTISTILNTDEELSKNNRRIKYDYEAIRNYYIENEPIALSEVGKKFGCTGGTVARIIDSDPNINRKARKYNYKAIQDYYFNNKNATNEEIAEKFGVKNGGNVSYILNKDPRYNKEKRNTKKYDYKAIAEYYDNNDVTQQEVADRFNIKSFSMVKYILDKQGVKIRK